MLCWRIKYDDDDDDDDTHLMWTAATKTFAYKLRAIYSKMFEARAFRTRHSCQ